MRQIYIGKWSFKPGPKGLCRYEFDTSADTMELKEEILTDIVIGAQYLDKEKSVLYASDEGFRTVNGAETGGIFAVKLKEDGSFGEILSYTRAANPKTSYIWPVKGGEYLVISNHSSSKAVRHAVKKGGQVYMEEVRDQASLNLLRLNEDGSVRELCDALIYDSTETDGNVRFPHMHNVMADPEGRMFIACDKGMDRIITFRVDTDSGKLIELQRTDTENNTAPRYTVFRHDTDIVYENNENWPGICSYRFNAETGVLELIQSLVIGDESYRRPNASDLVLNENGTMLYAALRCTNEIVMIRTDSTGFMKEAGRMSCLGKGPRGLYISGNRLFCMNQESGEVVCFTLNEQGMPDTEHAVISQVPLAGNMTMKDV
ncbi:MAG: beta-propeller fold lactonase family protein [Erysipelotrichaceae bacterium]|nr:beta-propeller fold lactonase family protein [Erysipelotrichaceae bacterium]